MATGQQASERLRCGILGAGTMGRGIAKVMYESGANVSIMDPDRDALTNAVKYVDCADVAASDESIASYDAMGKWLAASDVVFECVPENMELKVGLLEEASSLCGKDCILASNTSALDIDVLCERVRYPGRALGCHWFNPAEVVPGVEVCPSMRTGDLYRDRLVEILRIVGKVPSLVKNSRGFIGNRIQEAMMAEAFRCLEEGVATASEIDAIVRNTFGFRLAVCGPLEMLDQIGVEVERETLKSLAEVYGTDRYGPPAVLDEMISEGRLGIRCGVGAYHYGNEGEAVLDRRRKLFRKVLKARDSL